MSAPTATAPEEIVSLLFRAFDALDTEAIEASVRAGLGSQSSSTAELIREPNCPGSAFRAPL